MITSRVKPKGFKVKSATLKQIETSARVFRELAFGSREIKDIDLQRFLEEKLPEDLDLCLEIVEDFDCEELPKDAPAAVVGSSLKMRDACYIGIGRKNPRDVFTLFHELGHKFMGHERVFARSQLEEHGWNEDSEWQANNFASEVLIPSSVILKENLRTVQQLKDRFGPISTQAAELKLKKLFKYRI